jgi:hypothetical protein
MENIQNNSPIEELLEVQKELKDEMNKADLRNFHTLFTRACFYTRYAPISDEDREKYKKEINDLERRVTYLKGLFR